MTQHYLRFGSFKEQNVLKEAAVANYLRSPTGEYGIALNANVVAHTPLAIYKFLLINFPSTKFFIDPQTYIFQLDPIKYYSTIDAVSGKRNLKKSVSKMAQEYGPPIDVIETKMASIELDDFKNHISELTNKTLAFQENYLKKEYDQKKQDDGYDDYDDDNNDNQTGGTPEFLIAPYFYLRLERFDDYLDLNICAAKEALKKSSLNIAAELVIEKHILLDDDKIKIIAKKYNNIDGITKILLWVDGFDETNTSNEYLRKYVDFVKRFNYPVINLYGGYLSLLLLKKNILNAFCHGPGYGEYRGAIPVGGGIPTAKFYLPPLCKRIDFENAFTLIKAKKLKTSKVYFNTICDCEKCTQLIGNNYEKDFYESYGKYKLAKSGREVPEQLTLINNQIHYLLRRYKDIANDKLLQQFSKNSDAFIAENKSHKILSTEHLSLWKELLSEL